MALKIKLRPHEVVIINGSIIKNGPRKTNIQICNFSNVVREDDLITKEDASRTPVSAIYYAVQSLLTNPSIAQESAKQIQRTLAKLHVMLPDDKSKGVVMEVANTISTFNFYKALHLLKPLLEKQDELFPDYIETPATDAESNK